MLRTAVGGRLVRGALATLVSLLMSCAVASVAERREDGATVIAYVAQGAESIVSERRADALVKAREACPGKDFAIEREWDSTEVRFEPQNIRHLLVRCIDPTARAKAVTARAEAETGCERAVIEMESEISGSFVYRVGACGVRLVCDVRGAEVTCKRALSSENP